MRSIIVASLLLLLLALGGCGSKEDAFIGTWQVPPPAGEQPSATEILLVKKDKTFDASNHYLMGTWSVSGEKLLLQVNKVGGIPLEEWKKSSTAGVQQKFFDKPLTGTLSNEGKTLTVDPPTTGQGMVTLVFAKQDS